MLDRKEHVLHFVSSRILFFSLTNLRYSISTGILCVLDLYLDGVSVDSWESPLWLKREADDCTGINSDKTEFGMLEVW